MGYKNTIGIVHKSIIKTANKVDNWFDEPENIGTFRPESGGWTIYEILEHISLTSHFLLIIIRRHVEKAVKKATNGCEIVDGESDLQSLDRIGQRSSFVWIRPEHMEPTGKANLQEVRNTIKTQFIECNQLLESMASGEGSLVRVKMTVDDLGKIDMYQWIYFLVQHANRHLKQMNEVKVEAQK